MNVNQVDQNLPEKRGNIFLYFSRDAMNSREIESWALRVIERISASHPNEDFLVELKARWPENPNRTARRIAGHANAARGESILWLVGVDQELGVRGAAFEEMAEWWPQVQAEFDGVSPALRELNISWRGLTVVSRRAGSLGNPTTG